MKVVKQKKPNVEISEEQVGRAIKNYKVIKAPKPDNGRPHIGCGNGEWCGTPYCMGYC